MSTPDELARVLGEALYSPPVLMMRVLVHRPLGDDTEACATAVAALCEDIRDAVLARTLRPTGGITVTMWAVALQRARIGTAAEPVEEPGREWFVVDRQESWSAALPEWADARMYEAVVAVE